MGDKPVKDPKAERLAAALRENLKRRKAQARGRAAEAKPDDVGQDGSQEGAGRRTDKS